MSTTHKPIEISNVNASRIVVKHGEQEHVFDVRGFQHIRDTLGYGVNVISDFYDDGYSKPKWFIFATMDCFDPPLTLIRANSWEDAYEIYCDECEGMIKIDSNDLKDYGDDFQVNNNGTPIDPESVRGWEVEMIRIES